MANMDFEKMTDEELRAYLDSPMTAAVQAATERKAGEEAAAKVAAANNPYTDFMKNQPGMDLFLSGMGSNIMRVPRGLKELAIGSFGKPGEIEAYNRDKADQQKFDEALMNTWQGQLGSFGADAAVAAAAPARIPAQIALEISKAALSPTSGPIKEGVLSQLPTRAVQAGEAGAATAAFGAPLKMFGKKIGAMTGNFTPENEAMVEAGRAARRQGIVPTTGAMLPGGGSRGIEAGSSWYPEQVRDQARQFSQLAGEEVPVATSVLGQTTTRQIPGEALRRSIAEAGDKLKQQGSKMWKDLDSYVTTNNLPSVVTADTKSSFENIAQKYSPVTPRGNPNTDKNDVFRYIVNADDASNFATKTLKGMLNGKNVPTMGFSELHDMQTVVGKALARAKYDADARNAPASARQAVGELSNLYRSIANDVDRWSTTNPTAGNMFKQAKSYWRDTVVPGAINNDLYQKSARGSLGASNRGYDEPRQFFADIINKPEEAKLLYSTMDQKGRDLITSLHLLPDMGATLTAPKTQSITAVGPNGKLLETGIRAPNAYGNTIGTTSGALAGTKRGLAQMALGHLPFSRKLATSQGRQERLLANDAFRNSPLGRVMWAAGQKPEGEVESLLQRLRGVQDQQD